MSIIKNEYILFIGEHDNDDLIMKYFKTQQNLMLMMITSNKNILSRKRYTKNFDLVLITKNFNEHKSIYNQIKEFNIVYIVPKPLGRSLELSHYLANRFNLKDSIYEKISLFTDKYKFENMLDRLNLQKTESEFMNVEEFFELCSNFLLLSQRGVNLPFIVKPILGSGSRGVIAFLSEKDIISAKMRIKDISLNETIMISPLKNGIEYGIDALVVDNEVYVFGIRKKEMTPFPYRQEVGFEIQKFSYDNKVKEIETKLKIISNYTGIKNSLFHLDILERDEGIFIIEASPRPAGLSIYDVIWRTSFDIDVYLNFIKYTFLGETMEVTFRENNKAKLYRFNNYQEVKFGKDLIDKKLEGVE